MLKPAYTSPLGNQRGQASVFVLALLGVVLICLIFLYQSGRLTSEKMQLQNAADAAAYNVAVLEARSLNFAAYTNRAMVGNEVAVGQLIGLFSWTDQLTQTEEYADVYTAALEVAGQALVLLLSETIVGAAAVEAIVDATTAIIDGVAAVMTAVGLVMEAALEAIIPPTVAGLSLINEAYSLSQEIYHGATYAAEIKSLYQSMEDNILNTSFARDDLLKKELVGPQLSDLGVIALIGHLPSYWSGYTRMYTSMTSVKKKAKQEEQKKKKDEKKEEKKKKKEEEKKRREEDKKKKEEKQKDQKQESETQYEEAEVEGPAAAVAMSAAGRDGASSVSASSAGDQALQAGSSGAGAGTGPVDPGQQQKNASGQSKKKDSDKKNGKEKKQKKKDDDNSSGMGRMAATVREARDPFSAGPVPKEYESEYNKKVDLWNQKTRDWYLGVGFELSKKIRVKIKKIKLGSVSFDFNYFLGVDSLGASELRYKDNTFIWSAADSTAAGAKLHVKVKAKVLGIKIPGINTTLAFPPEAPFNSGGFQAPEESIHPLLPEDILLSELYGGRIPEPYGGAVGEPHALALPDVVKEIEENEVETYKGLRPYRDMTHLDQKEPAKVAIPFQAPFFLVGVTNPLHGITEKGPQFSGRLDLAGASGQAQVDRLGAIAKSQLYFARPTNLSYFERLDRKVENPNVFSPFWQARLVDTSNQDRFVALAMQQKIIWLTEKEKRLIGGDTLDNVLDVIDDVLGAVSGVIDRLLRLFL